MLNFFKKNTKQNLHDKDYSKRDVSIQIHLIIMI